MIINEVLTNLLTLDPISASGWFSLLSFPACKARFPFWALGPWESWEPGFTLQYTSQHNGTVRK